MITVQAQQAYNADPIFFSDPMPGHLSFTQNRVQNPASTIGHSVLSNNSDSTSTGISFHGSDLTPVRQNYVHQDRLYDPPTGYSLATGSPTGISASGSDPLLGSDLLLGHQSTLPYNNTHSSASGTAAASASHGLNSVTASTYNRPMATMKATGRSVLASTLHFHQLVTDEHLQLDDELHVPLTAVLGNDGSQQPVTNVVAVMVVRPPFLIPLLACPLHNTTPPHTTRSYG